MKDAQKIVSGSVYKEGKHYHWKVVYDDGKTVQTVMSNPLREFRTRKSCNTDLLNTILQK